MNKNKKILITLLLLFIFFIPVATYIIVTGSVLQITPKETLEILNKEEGLLIDIREPSQFSIKHIDGAINIPLSTINSLQSVDNIPATIKNKNLFLICNSGLSSIQAVKKLESFSLRNIYSVSGGMQAWTSSLDNTSACKFRHLLNGLSMPVESFRSTSYIEQWIAFSAAFIIKPFYLLLSFILFLFMRKLRSPDSVALRYAVFFFFCGEMFCAINYIFYMEQSYLFEYLHIYGMILSFCFCIYAITQALDSRIIHFSDKTKRCSLLNLCKDCYKYNDINCKLRNVFIIFVFSCLILTSIPILSSLSTVSYNTSILDYSYNYSHPVIFQILELRILPVISILFLLASLILLIINKKEVDHNAKLLFAGGLGFLGFSIFRLLFLKIYIDNLTWFVVAEEVTELIYMINLAFILWLFRRDIFRFKKPAQNNNPIADPE